LTNILNQFAKGRQRQFAPSSPEEYFALRLACLLGEPEAAGHYATLASQYDQSKLLSAYRRATSASSRRDLPARVFHDHLAAIGTNGGNTSPHPRLLAVRVERRAVAVAVFSGVHLEGRRVLQLSSDAARAEASTAGFIRAVLSENDCPSAAIESVSGDVRRAVLRAAIMDHCRANGISVWEVSGRIVLEALSHPPLKSRAELRDLMLRMWPVQGLKQSQLCALDAVALGLYVQTERLFAVDH
jgi:hypothetical protein